jgi:hypothetical protein
MGLSLTSYTLHSSHNKIPRRLFMAAIMIKYILFAIIWLSACLFIAVQIIKKVPSKNFTKKSALKRIFSPF